MSKNVKAKIIFEVWPNFKTPQLIIFEVWRSHQCCIQDFLREEKGGDSGKCLSGAFLVDFLDVIPVIFFYRISCFYSNIISDIALVLKGQKILFWSSLVRLEENFVGFCLLLIGLFFPNGKDKLVSITVHLPPIGYLELKSTVLNHK